jgi:hypothetical protein
MADGTVNFDNFAVNAPINLSNGNPAGSTIVAQLLAGAPGGSLAPVGAEVALLDASPGVGFGYFFGGERRITGIPDGGAADVAVRAWESSFGSYAAAESGGGQYGTSPTLPLSSTGNPSAQPPGTPVDLVGLQGFTLQVIPEPSTLALLGLGALALVVRRRK